MVHDGLEHKFMRTHHLSVIGSEDDDGIVGFAKTVERFANAPDHFIDERNLAPVPCFDVPYCDVRCDHALIVFVTFFQKLTNRRFAWQLRGIGMIVNVCGTGVSFRSYILSFTL